MFFCPLLISYHQTHKNPKWKFENKEDMKMWKCEKKKKKGKDIKKEVKQCLQRENIKQFYSI